MSAIIPVNDNSLGFLMTFIFPVLGLILGWNIIVLNLTLGKTLGCLISYWILKFYVPLSYGELVGPLIIIEIIPNPPLLSGMLF